MSMFVFGILIPLGFSCKSFFRLMLDAPPASKLVFVVLRRIRISKKVSSLPGKSYSAV